MLVSGGHLAVLLLINCDKKRSGGFRRPVTAQWIGKEKCSVVICHYDSM